MPNVTHYALSCCAVFHYAEGHNQVNNTECHYAEIHNLANNAQCHYAECHN